MRHTIIKFSKFTRVPTVCRSHKITRDALQFVDVLRATFRTYLQLIVSILITTIHATVAVVVHRTITHIQLIHHVYHAHNHLRIMRCITIDLHIEDMSTTCHLMIGSLHLGLMTSRALVIHGHMI